MAHLHLSRLPIWSRGPVEWIVLKHPSCKSLSIYLPNDLWYLHHPRPTSTFSHHQILLKRNQRQCSQATHRFTTWLMSLLLWLHMWLCRYVILSIIPILLTADHHHQGSLHIFFLAHLLQDGCCNWFRNILQYCAGVLWVDRGEGWNRQSFDLVESVRNWDIIIINSQIPPFWSFPI